MLTSKSEVIEIFSGLGRLHLANRTVTVNCLLRVYQEYAGDTLTLRHADGKFADLPHGDAAFAMMDRKPLDLELYDRRKAKVFVTDFAGHFMLTGPLG